jgi:hypothetical protein
LSGPSGHNRQREGLTVRPIIEQIFNLQPVPAIIDAHHNSAKQEKNVKMLTRVSIYASLLSDSSTGLGPLLSNRGLSMRAVVLPGKPDGLQHDCQAHH